MSRPYTSAAKQNLLATSAEEPFLILLEISHAGLITPIRIVNDVVDLVSNGNTFIALPFRMTLPDDVQGQIPQAQLEIDNVGRELTQFLESTSGGQGAKCKIIQVMRSNPNLIEFSISLDLTNMTITNEVVTGQLGFVNTLGQVSTTINFTPTTAPGLW